MTRTRPTARAAAAIALVCGLAGQPRGAGAECREVTVAKDEGARAEIERTLNDWRDAVAAGDVVGLSELVTEDAEFWTHGAPPLRGRQALTKVFEQLFAGFEAEQDFRCDELVVAGGWAFMRGLERNRLTPRAGGEIARRDQRAFSVLRRGEDGRWRFARGMTNVGPEAAAPARAEPQPPSRR